MSDFLEQYLNTGYNENGDDSTISTHDIVLNSEQTTPYAYADIPSSETGTERKHLSIEDIAGTVPGENDAYWNESVQSLANAFQSLITQKDKEGNGVFSDHFDAILNGDAAYDFSEKYVHPEKNIDDITYLQARTDEIEKVLKDSKYLDYTRKAGIEKYLRLIMPQYARRVEIEDLDRNFWVIAQVIGRTCDYLFNPDSLLNSILGNALTEILHLWQNTYRIWQAISDLDLKITDVENILGIGDSATINLVGPKWVSSCGNFNFTGLYPKIITGSGYRNIPTPFSNGLQVADNFKNFAAYCDYKNSSSEMRKKKISSDALFYGKVSLKNGSEIINSFNALKYILTSSLQNYFKDTITGKTNNELYKEEILEKINTSFKLVSTEANILLMNEKDYEFVSCNEGNLIIRDRETKDTYSFTNTAIVSENSLSSKEFILIALGNEISGVIKNDNLDSFWNYPDGVEHLPLVVTHSQNYSYAANHYYILEESSFNEISENSVNDLELNNKHFRIFYYRPKQSELRKEINVRSAYTPLQTVQLINDITRESVFTQRFYLFQGQGDYIDYEYLHGHLTFFGSGASLSDDFAEHGLYGFVGYSKMVSETESAFIRAKYNNEMEFEKFDRTKFSDLISTGASDQAIFKEIIDTALKDLSPSLETNYFQDQKQMLALSKYITSRYRGVLPVFFYGGVVSQPNTAINLTGLINQADPTDAFYRAADKLCVIPIYTNWNHSNTYLDIGIESSSEGYVISDTAIKCFSWTNALEADKGTDKENGQYTAAQNSIGKMQYRYLLNNNGIIPLAAHNSEFNYLIGYLFIFANSTSHVNVDINNLRLFGKVIENNQNHFLNGTPALTTTASECKILWK